MARGDLRLRKVFPKKIFLPNIQERFGSRGKLRLRSTGGPELTARNGNRRQRFANTLRRCLETHRKNGLCWRARKTKFSPRRQERFRAWPSMRRATFPR